MASVQSLRLLRNIPSLLRTTCVRNEAKPPVFASHFGASAPARGMAYIKAAKRNATAEKVDKKVEEKKKQDVPLGMLKADGSSKRFYKAAGVKEVEQNCPRTGALVKAWALTLDERGVRTPSNKEMLLPSMTMARTIALEFDVQDLHILPYTMPLTTLATTAIDQLSRAEVRKSAVGSMVKQLGTDLVTLRSTDPEDLVDRESQLWGPICDWAAQQYGCEVVTSEEWLSIEQNPALMRAVEADLNSRSDWTIAAIDQVAGATGSTLLSLAIFHGLLQGEAALAAARAVEHYQIDRWGKVESSGLGGHDIDEADMRSRIAASLLMHRLLPASHV